MLRRYVHVHVHVHVPHRSRGAAKGEHKVRPYGSGSARRRSNGSRLIESSTSSSVAQNIRPLATLYCTYRVVTGLSGTSRNVPPCMISSSVHMWLTGMSFHRMSVFRKPSER